ncbi:Uncharacterized protein APZ42_022036 [Daphnia magna]|uniref:Uncharacterized protein n=1 Tax=Daphnia magna TaxID=35525 RepID=A0A164VXT8_9CRUS|nr:Uncharacterized protein APZ42_022036 [Daphnia magna]
MGPSSTTSVFPLRQPPLQLRQNMLHLPLPQQGVPLVPSLQNPSTGLQASTESGTIDSAMSEIATNINAILVDIVVYLCKIFNKKTWVRQFTNKFFVTSEPRLNHELYRLTNN